MCRMCPVRPLCPVVPLRMSCSPGCAANARLRELVAERDARIGGLEMQVARIADLETLAADLQARVGGPGRER